MFRVKPVGACGARNSNRGTAIQFYSIGVSPSFIPRVLVAVERRKNRSRGEKNGARAGSLPYGILSSRAYIQRRRRRYRRADPALRSSMELSEDSAGEGRGREIAEDIKIILTLFFLLLYIDRVQFRFRRSRERRWEGGEEVEEDVKRISFTGNTIFWDAMNARDESYRARSGEKKSIDASIYTLPSFSFLPPSSHIRCGER